MSSARELPHARWRQISATALASGAVVELTSTRTRIKWDLAGEGKLRCLNPGSIELIGLEPGREVFETARGRARREDRDVAGRIVAWLRCRKCLPCLRSKARHWSKRAMAELLATPGRTWFFTGTLNPARVHQMRLAARQAAGEENYELFSERKRRQLVCRQLNAEITLWLKRIRKNSRCIFKYIIVIELHQSGEPHFHALLHEHVGSLSERILRSDWRKRMGIAQAKLVEVDKSAPWYVCKYISKSPQSRMRASLNYGRPKAPLGV